MQTSLSLRSLYGRRFKLSYTDLRIDCGAARGRSATPPLTIRLEFCPEAADLCGIRRIEAALCTRLAQLWQGRHRVAKTVGNRLKKSRSGHQMVISRAYIQIIGACSNWELGTQMRQIATKKTETAVHHSDATTRHLMNALAAFMAADSVTELAKSVARHPRKVAKPAFANQNRPSKRAA
jgi:hypothetical protein